MAREEWYTVTINKPTTDRTVINDMAYDEEVPLKAITILPGEVEVEYDDGHSQTYVTMAEATQRLQRRYKFIERNPSPVKSRLGRRRP